MNPINLFGQRGLARHGAAGTSGGILHDGEGFLLAWGDTVPEDGTAGYAAGCLFIKRGATDINAALYINIGDHDECDFDANGGEPTG